MTCEGRGRVRDPDAYNDPIEGYKMADSITCPACKGSGAGRRAHYEDLYKQRLQEWRMRLGNWKMRKASWESGLEKLRKAKLNHTEARVLGIGHLLEN